MFELKGLFSEKVFQYILLVFLILFIFNVQIINKIYLGIFFTIYSSIYIFINFFELKHFKKLWVLLPLLVYLIAYTVYQYLVISDFKLDIKNSLEIFFNLFFFSVIYIQNNNWVNIYKNINFYVCLIILYIFIQNFIFLENFFITTDIIFNLSDPNYNLASKNFLAIILNILMVTIIFNLNSKKNFIILVIYTTAIILTFSRTGLYLLLANFFISSILVKDNKIKIVLFIFLVFSSSFFWNEKIRSLYIENKKNIIFNYTKANDGHNPTIFNFSWFNKKTKSFRPQYYFITFENLKNKPFFGSGLGSFKINNKLLDDNYKVKRLPDPHSTILLILYELGILGLISFIILFKKCIFSILNSKQELVYLNLHFLIILVLSSLFINMFYSPFLWFLIATSYSYKNEQYSYSKI